MAVDPHTALIIRRITRQLANHEKRIRNITRKPQLAASSVEDGSIGAYDADGIDRGAFGKQWDGTYTVSSRNGTKPPTPDMADVEGHPGFLRVQWHGNFVDENGYVDQTITAPEDWQRIGIHVGPEADPNFTPDIGPESTTYVGSIESASGGSFVVALPPDNYNVRLVTVNQSGKFSDPSAPVVGTSSATTSADDIAALQDAVAGNTGDIGDIGSQAGQTASELEDYKNANDATLSTLQAGFDVLNGLGNAGVEEDYFFVGDDPTLQTLKLVQISTFVQDALGAGDGAALADALGLIARDSLGDVDYENTDPPMTQFYNAFSAAGLAVRPWNA